MPVCPMALPPSWTSQHDMPCRSAPIVTSIILTELRMRSFLNNSCCPHVSVPVTQPPTGPLTLSLSVSKEVRYCHYLCTWDDK